MAKNTLSEHADQVEIHLENLQEEVHNARCSLEDLRDKIQETTQKLRQVNKQMSKCPYCKENRQVEAE